MLLDLTMPRLNGSACYRELRDRYPGLPVILTSGFSQEEAVQPFAGEAALVFVQKPLDFDTLSRAVNDALERE